MTFIPQIEDLWRRIEGLIDSSGEGTASIVMDEGDWVILSTTASNDAEAKILTQFDLSVYLGSVSTANKFPAATNVDPADWQIVGPYSDWGSTNNINTVWRYMIRNISGGNGQTILFRMKVRAISNTRTVGTSV